MPRESKTSLLARCREIVRRLKMLYPDATCSLDHLNAFELTVATILAAQCTDAKVNTVTPTLFSRYPDPFALAQADIRDVEEIIHPLGFYHQKAISLVEMSRQVVSKHDGQIPGTLEELVKLRGVGRKTANVVLGACFSGGGIVVDTHCRRLSQRLGLTREDDPKKIEFDLMKKVDTQDWSIYGHLMVYHGRAVCEARKPDCKRCVLLDICPEGQRREPGALDTTAGFGVST